MHLFLKGLNFKDSRTILNLRVSENNYNHVHSKAYVHTSKINIHLFYVVKNRLGLGFLS
jgi:hypothetical protein